MTLRTCLVTGGSGSIGRVVIETLDATGCNIIATFRPGGGILPACMSHHTAVSVDHWTPKGLREALIGHDFQHVINLAAYGVVPKDRKADIMYGINVTCPLTLAELAAERHVESFVHAGSSAEYAPCEQQNKLTEQAPLQSDHLYGSSKAAGGLLLSAFARHLELPLVVLRVFGVFGPGEAEHRLLPSLLSKVSIGERVALSTGFQIRDYTYVNDIANAFVDASQKLSDCNSKVGTYNLCSGIGTSVREFANLVVDAIDKPRSLLGFGDLPTRPDDLASVVGDNSAFCAAFGPPIRTPLGFAIAESVSSFKDAMSKRALQ